MEGRILGGRYELVERIGGGGMAIVYKARCKLLNRFVAVKVLRSEFINDEEFVKRFSVEAQSAASLSHPNIVPIYDVGFEDSIHYIVMEYIDGVTLKEYISQKGALPWEEAVNIAIQICSAIEHAHKNHIVHRDIKPLNIMLTRDGIAKVTDFGIARAVSSSTITMAGSTIGSVHYFSPEQARGGFIDEKSDIYSLGVTLYEMVTGKIPFDGETPVSIALKHIQDRAEQPFNINSAIPAGVNHVIMKAIEKEQIKRYQAASEMLADMYRVVRNPQYDPGDRDDAVEYTTRRARAVSKSELDPDGRHMSEEESGKEAKKKKRLNIVLAILTSVLLFTVFIYIAFNIVVPALTEDSSSNYEVGNYVGRKFNEVRDELVKAGVAVKDPNMVYNDNIRKDEIISQKPEPGKIIKLGGYVSMEFDVSNGPQMIKIPNLKEIDYRDAKNNLGDLGLLPSIKDEYSETVGKGYVIRTEPEFGQEVKVGSDIIIYKSIGPEIKQTKVPDMVGKSLTEAKRLLSDAGLVLGKQLPEEGNNFVDKVIKQSPAAGEVVDEGTAVDITLENGANQGRTVRITINLGNKSSYNDTIKVYVDYTPSDTGKTVIFINNEQKNKSDFPFTISIPIPTDGSTRVRVYLDGVLQSDVNYE